MTFVTTLLQDGRSRKIRVNLLWELVAASVREVSRTNVNYGSETRMAKCEGPDLNSKTTVTDIPCLTLIDGA